MEQPKSLSIKEWSVEDRPREKLLSKGISSLSDAELLAILIRIGSPNESAVDLAKKILMNVNYDLNELGKLSVDKLVKDHKGIGKTKAVTIIAALELGRRRKISEIIIKKKITGSKDIFEIFHSLLGDLPHEEFWILLLNRSNRIIDKYKISQGGITGTVTDVRIILKTAIDKLATSIILCHNHPSGNMDPSEADIKITTKLKEAAKIVDIPVLDHVIVTDYSYFSFADEGIM